MKGIRIYSKNSATRCPQAISKPLFHRFAALAPAGRDDVTQNAKRVARNQKTFLKWLLVGYRHIAGKTLADISMEMLFNQQVVVRIGLPANPIRYFDRGRDLS
jgi:hypothetical protein